MDSTTCWRGTELRRRLALSLVRTDAGAEQDRREIQGALRSHDARCPNCRGARTVREVVAGRSVSQVVLDETPQRDRR